MATVITPRSQSVFYYLNPLAMARNLWQHRDLIRQFTKREIEGRYRGSFLGLFWSFVNPLVLLLIYTFVFGVVFKSRWSEARTDNLSEFAIILFCGLIAYNVFGESVNRAPTTITNVPNYVKKVVFPLEILPASVLGGALFHYGISTCILITVHLMLGGVLSLTIFLLPLVMMPLMLLTIGISWFVASVGVFIRDVTQIVAILTQILFFLTPIFYSIQAVPAPMQIFMHINPLSVAVENVRRVVIWGTLPDWYNLSIWMLISIGIALLGYSWFMKSKKAFADVI